MSRAPNSPPEREMTAPMRPPAPSRWADAVPAVNTITTAPPPATAELTRNASSWELLDMMAHGGSAAALSTTSHAEICGGCLGGGVASPPRGAAGAASGEDSTSPASPQSHEPSTGRVRGTSPEPPSVLLQLLDAEGTRSLPRVATANAASAACNAAAPTPLPRHAHSGGAVPKRHRHRSGSPRHGDGPLLSPAHSISTVWSLISTPSQTHLPASHDDPAPFGLPPAATDAAPATTGGYTVSTASSPSRHHRPSQFLVAANAGGVSSAAVSPLPADAPAMVGVWPVESLPSSLPLEMHHHGHHIDVPPSASSYGACSAASGGTRASAANPMLVPRVMSVATTSLTSEGEACLGESNHTGAHSPVAAENTTTTTTTLLTPTPAAGAVLWGALEPPHATSGRGTPRCADVATFLTSHADSQAAAVETPEPGFAWLPKHLVALCDRRRSATPSHDPDTGSDAAQAEQAGTASQRRQREQRRAAAWLSYRISFLSSSSLVASLRSAGVAGGVAQPAQDPATAAASHFSTENPTHAAPSYAAFTIEASWLWWSRAGVVCSSGSRRALHGLNRACAFVWQDIKEHWYPQLRLVLGDHSSARKSRRSRRARRRHASLATGAGAEGAPAAAAAAAAASCSASDNEGLHEAAIAAAPESMRWRSVSSPCLFNGDVRVTRDSAAHHYMAWKERRACTGATATAPHGQRHSDSNSSSVCAAAVPSAKEGMKLYMAITAEAVASAAQGLLVFLL